MEFVIDTEILVTAESSPKDHEHDAQVMQLLIDIRRCCHFIAVDYDNEIFGEYYRNLTPSSLISRILRYIVSRNQIRFVASALPAGIRNGLASLHFDEDDHVFVGVASRTTDKTLVAEESDYSPEVVEFLSHHGIDVLDCESACGSLESLDTR